MSSFHAQITSSNIIVQISFEDQMKTHSSSELELEWGPLEEGRTAVVAAHCKAVRTLLPYVYAVDYF